MKHLAVMKQPYLDLIIQGKKTIESRFTKNLIDPFPKSQKRNPFQKTLEKWQEMMDAELSIRMNDEIYFKESGISQIFYFAFIDKAMFVSGSEQSCEMLRKYQKEICINEQYIQSKSDSNYLSLIWIKNISKINGSPIICNKQDRRAWISNIKIYNGTIILKGDSLCSI